MKQFIILLSFSALAHGKFFSLWSSENKKTEEVQVPLPSKQHEPQAVSFKFPESKPQQLLNFVSLNDLQLFGNPSFQGYPNYVPHGSYETHSPTYEYSTNQYFYDKPGGTPVYSSGSTYEEVHHPVVLNAYKPVGVETHVPHTSSTPTTALNLKSILQHPLTVSLQRYNPIRFLLNTPYSTNSYNPVTVKPENVYYPATSAEVLQPHITTSSNGNSVQTIYPEYATKRPENTEVPTLGYPPVNNQQALTVSHGVSQEVSNYPEHTVPNSQYGPPSSGVVTEVKVDSTSSAEFSSQTGVNVPHVYYGLPSKGNQVEVTKPAAHYGTPEEAVSPNLPVPEQPLPSQPQSHYGLPTGGGHVSSSSLTGSSGELVNVDTLHTGNVEVGGGLQISGGLGVSGSTGVDVGSGIDISGGVNVGGTGGVNVDDGLGGGNVDALAVAIDGFGEVIDVLGGAVDGVGVGLESGIGSVNAQAGLSSGGTDGNDSGNAAGGLISIGLNLLRGPNGELIRVQSNNNQLAQANQSHHIVFPLNHNENSLQVPVFQPVNFRSPVLADNFEMYNLNVGTNNPSNYEHSYDLKDGTRVLEKGQLKTTSDGQSTHTVFVKSGEYELYNPDGQKSKVQWIADENGFRIVN